ncbi:hypothetical protein [Mesonia sp. K7]|uniref:hypothetical protein n=1 Tax=Mesonia sp. K7 TaxID=2218606 RepID=UPI000DA9001A|nr:hypothetical protein [Mesonia sp. K7]PZD76812.1 hypothetical protein DNG35_10670 [Mesonia sp. K7]
MKQVNYITHLKTFFEKVYEDDNLNPTHISLYLALFSFWNNTRFAKWFYINRQEVMRMAHIGSKGTYHKCINQLHQWKYIKYQPSNNPQRGSKIYMFDTCTTFTTTTGTGSEQVVGHYINFNKHDKHKKYKKDFLKVKKEKNYNEPL